MEKLKSKLKKLKLGLLGSLFIFNIVFTVVLIIELTELNKVSAEPFSLTIIEELLDPDLSKWDIFKVALKWQESHCNPSASNSNAVGLYAITPIYVVECNNILGYEEFNLKDRLDSTRSEEMFDLFQAEHNPMYSMERAIKLHNPTAGSWYRTEVMERYYLLLYFYTKFLGFELKD